LATLARQVLEEYNSLPTTQTTKQLKLLNKYLLMVTFENGKNY